MNQKFLSILLNFQLVQSRSFSKVSRMKGSANAKFFMCLLFGVFMNALIPICADASNHITVTKEIFVANEIPMIPNAITETDDGGYVIAGSNSVARATRIKANGEVVWHYVHSSKRTSHLFGAAMLPDGSVILCGDVRENQNKDSHILGLIVHVASDGKVISERSFRPSGRDSSALIYLKNCFAVDNGVVIVGSILNTTVDLLHETHAPSHLFLLLDKNGEIEFEKVSPNIGSDSVQKLPDNTFVSHNFMVLPHAFFSYFVSHVDLNGTVLANRAIPGWSMLVESVLGNNEIHLLKIHNENSKSIVKLNQQLEESDPVNFSIEVINPKKAYFLSDHSLALFGNKALGSNSSTSSIEWISPDFKQNEFLLFEPHYSSTIYAAIPTGSPGEFVLTRTVAASKHLFGADEKRTGVILTFVQIK